MFKKLGSFFNDLSTSKKYSEKKPGPKGSHQGFDFLNLIRDWEKIVGSKLAKTTIPLNNQYGNLVVLTNHPAISQTLSFLEDDIKKNIFKEFPSLNGKINRIYYQTNSAFFEKKMEEAIKRGHLAKGNENALHPYSPKYIKLKGDAESIFRDIDDDEIKNILISLYIQHTQDN
jgi:Dna[CI] antecedent, DciA